MIRGAIWDGVGLIVADDLELRPLAPGEVRVRVRRSGICHSDLNMMGSAYIRSPVVLGHEAAGEIIELGDAVEGWRIGDAVLIGTQTPCGACRECDRQLPHNCAATWGFDPDVRFRWRGRNVLSFANVSSFAGETVVRADQLLATGDLPPEQAALIGCAVSTGMAAAQRLGRVAAGDRVAVFGIGGIGVNAVAGARLARAEVLAIDANPAKEAIARHFGAITFHAVAPGEDGAAIATAIAERFGRVDVAIECSGAVAAVEAAIRCPKLGGRTVLIGMGAPGGEARLPLDQVLLGREIVATMNGGAIPARDYPDYIEAARSGALDVAAQVSGVWPLGEIDQAIAALRAGEVTRAILDHER